MWQSVQPKDACADGRVASAFTSPWHIWHSLSSTCPRAVVQPGDRVLVAPRSLRVHWSVWDPVL